MVKAWAQPIRMPSSSAPSPARGGGGKARLQSSARTGLLTCRPRRRRPAHSPDDLAQRVDKAAALVRSQDRQDALIDLRGDGLDAAQNVLPLGGEAHGIH